MQYSPALGGLNGDWRNGLFVVTAIFFRYYYLFSFLRSFFVTTMIVVNRCIVIGKKSLPRFGKLSATKKNRGQVRNAILAVQMP
ncbi:MAG: hypothetical protein CSB48_05825 [Proteobacteria bacterium]|nr:MAG: hypothetical protein CSB48_05825 [Pseudomonadota bacterium]